MFQKRVQAAKLAVWGLALAGFSSLALAQVGMQGLQAQMGQTPAGVAGAAGMGAGGAIAGGLPSIRSAEALPNPAAPNNLLNGQLPMAMPIEPLKPNDFQKFVLETTGQKLPVYGQAFFENLQFSQRLLQAQQGLQTGGARFAPIDSAPVSGDYLLGPGDQLAIRGWGSLDMDVRATVDRKGVINVPRVGAISLAGVKASQADEVD